MKYLHQKRMKLNKKIQIVLKIVVIGKYCWVIIAKNNDSRVIGCIDGSSIVGAVKFKLIPWNEIGIPK